MTRIIHAYVNDFSYANYIHHEHIDPDNIKFVYKEIPKTGFSIIQLIAPEGRDFWSLHNYGPLKEQIFLWGYQLEADFDKIVRRELKKMKLKGGPRYMGSSGLGSSMFFAPTSKVSCLFDLYSHQLKVFGADSLYYMHPRKYPNHEQAMNECAFINKFSEANNVIFKPFNHPYGPSLPYVSGHVFQHLDFQFNLLTINESHVKATELLNEIGWPFHYNTVLLYLKQLVNDEYINWFPLYKDNPLLPVRFSKLDLDHSNNRHIKNYIEGLMNYLNTMISKYGDILLYNKYLFE